MTWLLIISPYITDTSDLIEFCWQCMRDRRGWKYCRVHR